MSLRFWESPSLEISIDSELVIHCRVFCNLRISFLRESVGLRGYGQKDPLIEYKNEGYDMFLEMMTNMRRNVIYSMFMFQPKTDSDDKN